MALIEFLSPCLPGILGPLYDNSLVRSFKPYKKSGFEKKMTSHDTENKRIKRKIKFDNGLRKHKENC